MRRFYFLICALFLVTSSTPAQKSTKSAAREVIDQDYVQALSAANHFLTAWATRNEEDGLALLSLQLKNKYPEEYFRYYISGLSNPHHQAFEMGRGKRLSSGHFAFPVVMYECYTGLKEIHNQLKPLTIVVVQSSPDAWLVDELPGFVAAEPKNN
jgi:hypothetical protein